VASGHTSTSVKEVSRYPCPSAQRQAKEKEKKVSKMTSTDLHDQIESEVLQVDEGLESREEQKYPKIPGVHECVQGALWSVWSGALS
jgi:hypothetical protein